ncbi:glomulin-like [Pholidichthys leucotaenia]
MAMKAAQVDDIIQRWRHTPEEDLKPEDYQQFRNLGCACLTEGESGNLLRFVQEEKNQMIVKSMGCVLLVPLITEAVKKKKSVDHCQSAIAHVTKTCSPDEVLQRFHEIIRDIDPGAISETITVLLPHLQTVLLGLDEKRPSCLGSVLTALQQQLSRLPIPYTEQQEEADEFGLCRCCAALAQFLQPFTEEVRRTGGDCDSTAGDQEMKKELLQFCMRSLREPLLEAELNRSRKSPLWLFAEDIVVMLCSIRVSLWGILFFASLKDRTATDQSQSRSCLSYLLFVQSVSVDSFPAVFSPVFVLRCNMEYVNQLLSSKKESHLLKGLALCEKSLESVQDNSLPVSLLELNSFYSAPQRESGLKVFQLFIDKLDVEAKHKFFRCMLKTSNHAGVESYIVKNIRNQLEFSLTPGHENEWFLGTAFLPLLKLVLSLPHGADTDLLSGMDKIMENLNLLRYLMIRDKELRKNAAMWEKLCKYKDEFVKMLRVCIGMSRAYYSSELKALREAQKLKAKESRNAAQSSKLVKTIKIKHEKVSNMSQEVQHQVLQSALVTFDLMESLIVRTEEIEEEKLSKLN